MTEQDQILKDQLDSNKALFSSRDGYIAELGKLYCMAIETQNIDMALHLLDKIRSV